MARWPGRLASWPASLGAAPGARQAEPGFEAGQNGGLRGGQRSLKIIPGRGVLGWRPLKDPRLRPVPARRHPRTAVRLWQAAGLGRIPDSWHAARGLNSASQPLLAIASRRGGSLAYPAALLGRSHSLMTADQEGPYPSTQSHCVIALTVSGQLLVAVSGQIPMTVNNHADGSGATADPHAKPPFGAARRPVAHRPVPPTERTICCRGRRSATARGAAAGHARPVSDANASMVSAAPLA